MKHIKENVAALLKTQESWYVTLLTHWQSAMGELHNKMCLEKTHNATLFIGVYEASWMHELYLLSPMLLKTINAFLGKDYVKELRFKVASQKIRLRSTSFARQERTPPPPLKKRALLPQEQQALAQISDVQLRSALELFLMRCSQERENEKNSSMSHRRISTLGSEH